MEGILNQELLKNLPTRQGVAVPISHYISSSSPSPSSLLSSPFQTNLHSSCSNVTFESTPITKNKDESLAQNRTYELSVRQQPRQARACGISDKDRRAIDPIPIVSLSIKEGEKQLDEREYGMEMFLLHASLWSEDGKTEYKSKISSKTPLQILIGNTVVNGEQFYDEFSIPSYFFLFGGLSVRLEGRFILKFTLMNLIGPSGTLNIGNSSILASASSEAFTVYSSKAFPGLMSPSKLALSLEQQGVKFPTNRPYRRKLTQDSPDEDSPAKKKA